MVRVHQGALTYVESVSAKLMKNLTAGKAGQPVPGRRISKELGQHVFGACPNITVLQNGQMRQHATGTLFRLAEHRFLVTAAHVVSLARKYECELYVPSGGRFVRIEGPCLEAVSEKFDTAIIDLPEKCYKQLSNSSFLLLRNVQLDWPEDGIYFLHGYPCSWSQPYVEEETTYVPARPLGLLTVPYSGPTDTLPSEQSVYDPQYHILLDCARKGLKGMARKPAKFPSDLSGISGSSVWLTGAQSGFDPEWNPEKAKVVGVQTHWYKSAEALRATGWRSVLTGISKEFPELLPSIQLTFPTWRQPSPD